MRSPFRFLVPVLAGLLATLGCTSESSSSGGVTSCGPGTHLVGNTCVLDDPTGTITTALDNGCTGAPNNALNLFTGANSCSSGQQCLFMNCSNNFVTAGITDMGVVGGLAAITDAPASGYASGAFVEPGHGYVVRITVSGTTTYARIYVDRRRLNTSGGIIGAVLKWTHQANGATTFDP